jgi:phosphoglycerol transferase MdoB-like AlkP superfamily enzyme
VDVRAAEAEELSLLTEMLQPSVWSIALFLALTATLLLTLLSLWWLLEELRWLLAELRWLLAFRAARQYSSICVLALAVAVWPLRW